MSFRAPVTVIGLIVKPKFNDSIPYPAASKVEKMKVSVVLFSTGFLRVLKVNLIVLPPFTKV